MKIINRPACTIALLLCFTSLHAVAAEAPVAKQKLVFQISDADPGKWNLALNNAKNVQETLGAENVDAEIVVYGPGIGMLKSDSIVGNRVEEARKANVNIVACQITMKNLKLTEDDMLPNLHYVPAGVVELIKKHNEGYAYIRP
jgi:uncharacterized protein